VLGVYDPDLVPRIARALAHMPVDHALVVHGSGLDEIAIHDETIVAEVTGGSIEEYSIHPSDLGLDRAGIETVAGGSPAENADHLVDILEGTADGPMRDIVLANAGAALYVAGEAATLADGAEAAGNAIDSGAARRKLTDLEGVPAA
jgi:anthranilate phosphoribosyltransferase